MSANLFGRIVLTASIFGVSGGAAMAQVMDNPVAIPVTVHARFTTNGTSQTLTLKWFGETNQAGDAVTWSKNGSGTVTTDPQQINLRPGKTYGPKPTGVTMLSLAFAPRAGLRRVLDAQTSARGGGIYHVINWIHRQWVFAEEASEVAFAKALSEGCGRFGWVLHAYCNMRNHFRLAPSRTVSRLTPSRPSAPRGRARTAVSYHHVIRRWEEGCQKVARNPVFTLTSMALPASLFLS